MLDVRRLRLLSELSRRGTIAEVAKAVGYTPSAVSQSLARLEREAGTALLERDGRRVRLTPAARSLVARTDRVLAELDAAESELAAEHETVRGNVVIGAFPSAAAGLVVPATRELRERHAELSCTVREHEPEDGLQLLRSGELDVLVSESYDDVGPASAGGLEQHPLLTEPLLLVLPPDHPASEPVRLETLRDADWIAGLAGTQFAAALERACRSAGFAPRVVHRADDAGLHQGLAAAGLGIGLLPALACIDSGDVRFARVAPPAPQRRVAALVRRGAARRPALAAALEALRRRGAPAGERSHGAAPVSASRRPIGRIESPLVDPASAPKQGREGAPEAWLVFEPAVLAGLEGIRPGAEIVVVTWLHLGDRGVLRVHPRDDPANPMQGVFNTRSADRPNPIGLHPVRVVSVEGGRVRVRDMEAVDGTPIVDLKPVLRLDGLAVSALPPLPDVRPGDDLAGLLAGAAPPDLGEGDVLVVAHKVVSKAEGRVRALERIEPGDRARALAAEHGKDPRLVQAVLDESAEVVRARGGVLICRTRSGLVCANAGVDQSNASRPGELVLLPEDPDASARGLREGIAAALGVRPAVVIADSFGRPWRLGQTDVAIGAAGLAPLEEWSGRPDAYGRELRVTSIAVADAVAAAADLARAKDARRPAVLVRGLDRHVTADDGPGAAALRRPEDADLFR